MRLCSQERHRSVPQPGEVLGAQSRMGGQGRWAVGAVFPCPDPARAFPKDIPQVNARQALSLGGGVPTAGQEQAPPLPWSGEQESGPQGLTSKSIISTVWPLGGSSDGSHFQKLS